MKISLTVVCSALCLLMGSASLAKSIPAGFKKEVVHVNGVAFNVYRGGRGEPLLLLHGFGQSALMWTPVMKDLKDKYTIIAPDLRGAGLSDAPTDGYEKVTMATDMKKILEHYNISKARVVGHDIGLMVAYAFAAKYPESTEKLVVMDAFVPGVGPGDAIYNSPDIWHFRFNGPYAEALTKGRERVLLDGVWEVFAAKPHSISEADKKYYTAQYARPGRIRAAFGWFKAMPQDAKDNKELSKKKLTMPVLALGGEKSLGQALFDTMKEAAVSPQGHIVQGCGHWMLEECYGETIKTLDQFLSAPSQNISNR